MNDEEHFHLHSWVLTHMVCLALILYRPQWFFNIFLISYHILLISYYCFLHFILFSLRYIVYQASEQHARICIWLNKEPNDKAETEWSINDWWYIFLLSIKKVLKCLNLVLFSWLEWIFHFIQSFSCLSCEFLHHWIAMKCIRFFPSFPIPSLLGHFSSSPMKCLSVGNFGILSVVCGL